MTQQYYVSVTGLRLKRPWHILAFVFYAAPSFMQAKKATGNLFADTRNIKGTRHSLTAWQSKKDMLAFAHSGSHKKAIAAFAHFFEGETCGYMAVEMPTWEDALIKLKEIGRPYVASKKLDKGSS